MGRHFKLNQCNISVSQVTEEKNAGERGGGKLELSFKAELKSPASYTLAF